MEPGKFDNAIRDTLNGQLFGDDQGAKERIWNAVEQQLKRKPLYPWWKVAALILILLMPSAILWRQNRNQAATIKDLGRQVGMLAAKPAGMSLPGNTTPQYILVHDTIFRQHPAEVVTKTDTFTQIRIVKDTVIVYRPAEMAFEPESSEKVPQISPSPVSADAGNYQENQRAEFLLNPEPIHTTRKQKANRSFTFRFSLGGVPESTAAPAGLQTRL